MRDDAGVTCRCWNWRQCVRTRITCSTSSAAFILDGLAALGGDALAVAGQELAEQITALYPGARLSVRQLGASVVPHAAASRWVQRFTAGFIEAARPRRHAPGDRWFAGGTFPGKSPAGGPICTGRQISMAGASMSAAGQA